MVCVYLYLRMHADHLFVCIKSFHVVSTYHIMKWCIILLYSPRSKRQRLRRPLQKLKLYFSLVVVDAPVPVGIVALPAPSITYAQPQTATDTQARTETHSDTKRQTRHTHRHAHIQKTKARKIRALTPTCPDHSPLFWGRCKIFFF
jgi:hypothetical protein